MLCRPLRPPVTPVQAPGDAAGSDGDEHALPTLPPRRRPAQFNRLFKALVRHMAEQFDRWDIAYAMDRTGRYFTEEQQEKKDDPALRRWREALGEFDRMPEGERFRWRERVMRYRGFGSVLRKGARAGELRSGPTA